MFVNLKRIIELGKDAEKKEDVWVNPAQVLLIRLAEPGRSYLWLSDSTGEESADIKVEGEPEYIAERFNRFFD